MKFDNAPISEVIFGISFKKLILNPNIIFEALNDIFKDYSQIQLMPLLPEQVLSIDGNLSQEINPKNTGQALYRCRTSDNQWLIQLQGNKFYLNWVRTDDKSVGHYPGYTKIKKKFLEQVEKLIKLLPGVDIKKQINGYDLTYIDRIEWRKHIDSLSQLSNLFALELIPFFKKDIDCNLLDITNAGMISGINGFLISQIKSMTVENRVSKLQYRNTMQGFLADMEIAEWFDKAHELQLGLFEKSFKEEVKTKWR